MTCVQPTSSTTLALYDFTGVTEVLEGPNFPVGGVVCATGAFASGTVTTTVCAADGGEYGVTGCQGTKKGNRQCSREITISSEKKSRNIDPFGRTRVDQQSPKAG